MSKRVADLTMEQKHQISHIFEPLLSEVFGGDKYKKYFPADMITTAKTVIHSELRKTGSVDSKVLRAVHDSISDIERAKTAQKILTIISEMVLIDEELPPDP